MKREVRKLPTVQPGQTVLVEVDRPICDEEAHQMQRAFRRAGLSAVIIGDGARIVGVCNIRPWKRPR